MRLDDTHIISISPPARWGLLDFMSDARLLLLVVTLLPLSPSSPLPPSPDLICQLLIAVIFAGHHLPVLDRSGRRRTSSASSWSQWASSDLICQLSIAVGLAGPQPARVWALWASPDLNRRVGALWASPDLNRRDSARRGLRRTSTGPQRPETQPYRMPKKMPDRMSAEMPHRMSDDMTDRMPDRFAR